MWPAPLSELLLGYSETLDQPLLLLLLRPHLLLLLLALVLLPLLLRPLLWLWL